MSQVIPATDADIAEAKDASDYLLNHCYTIGARKDGNRLAALIARIDLEVAGRKGDAERIKGLEDVIWRNVDPIICSKKDDAIVASCNPDLQHAPSCLLWKGPTE